MGYAQHTCDVHANMESQTMDEKSPMTDEERLALCKKLDEELDEFINGLERKRYTDGWSEDTWEEEMNKHPFFMKDAPKDELSPLAEGLAKLKYDPEENTPLELANNYKEDGNFNFKHKNYRLAILGYTEGIKMKCGDSETEASLYNNRAASHFQLKNYRSALIDSEKALSHKPTHHKARIRAAKCAMIIQKYDKCIEHCEKCLLENPNDKEAADMLKNSKRLLSVQERDKRKKDKDNRKIEEERKVIINAILERGIKIHKVEDAEDLDLSLLEPTACLPGADGARVHIIDGILRWPILTLYPEYQMTDFIQNCPENVPLSNQLDQLFPAPWDSDNKYSMSSIHVYFEGYDKKPHRVDPNKNLGDLLVEKYFEVKAGTPAFFILVKNSPVEKRFIESYI